ncbi:hypothetical protein MKZ38_001515 [Zalerion maritima]|uniref:Translation initiation factor IF2/IF5 domain-containing protein n=1 Tax=Zalerion maritima TaxID=339359 RepID=A0AAD5RQ89_9PEZI|nr:hypothetical protein MKZ38_001515 [Zalerion maritima]
MSSEEIPRERKARKSVAFTDEQIVVDADGSVTMAATPDDKDATATALSHTPRTPPLSAALGDLNTDNKAAADPTELPPPVDGDLEPTLMKKKKKKKAVDADGEGPADDAADGGDGALDLTLKKKKKKKVPKEDDFAKKLEAINLKDGPAEGAVVEEGDMDEGTGIWGHDEEPRIPFNLVLGRLFKVMAEKNPDHAQSGTKSYKIPPPQCMREGNKKTIFANIADICKRMKRTEEHVTAYLFAELGTSGSTDGSRRLVIKGRFQQKQIENVLRKYIMEYVTCKTCKSADTELSKGENRLYFITCNSCGSRRSVNAIKTGFSAQIGKRKKMH